MKILQIARQFYPSPGGVEEVVAQLARAFIQLGHQCEVVTLNRLFYQPHPVLPAEDRWQSIPVHRLAYLGSRRFFFAPQVLRWVRRFDVVHVHNTDFFCDFLSHMRWLHRRPLLLATHGGFFHTSDTTWKRLYFHTITRSALRHFDVVAADSEPDRRRFQPICQQVRIIPDGVDMTTYDALPKRPEPGLFVYIGRLVSNKRIEDLLQTLALVRPQWPMAHLVIIGADFDQLQPALMAHAQALHIAEAVQFLGAVPPATLQDHLARAQFFVSGSIYESFGISVLEAMASGTPPIVNRLPVFEQFISAGQNGWFCNYAQAGQAAQTWLTALQTPVAQWSAMGANARTVAAQYDWGRIAQIWEKLYQTAMEKTR